MGFKAFLTMSCKTADNSEIGLIDIFFEGKTVANHVQNYTGFSDYRDNTIYLNSFSIAFIKGDLNAFERIKKALLNLKNLAVDKDPFAN